MGIGVSVFLLAAGAILAFAVDMPATGLDIGALGVILMLVGGAGLLAAMVLWNDWHPGRRREIDLYDGLDEPDLFIGRRSPVVYDEPLAYEEPVAYQKPVAERRVTSRRIIYDR
ncbi:MAG: DUF6458 family protein [Acidimicrobiia bacterium]